MPTIGTVISFLFWLPPATVVLWQLLRTWEFVQRHNFSLRNIYSVVRWGIGRDRPLWNLIAKVSSIPLLLVFIVKPDSVAPLLAAGLVYALWVYEAFSILEKFYTGKLQRLKLSNPALLMTCASIVTMAIVPIFLSAFLSVNSVPTTTIISDIQSLLPTSTNLGIYVPLAYIFIVFSSLVAIVYDIGTPAIILGLLFISKPVRILLQKLQTAKARYRLKLHPNLQVVYIIGGPHTRLSASALQHFLTEHTTTALPRETFNHVSQVANYISHNLPHHTEVLLIHLDPQIPALAQEVITTFPAQVIIWLEHQPELVDVVQQSNPLIVYLWLDEQTKPDILELQENEVLITQSSALLESISQVDPEPQYYLYHRHAEELEINTTALKAKLSDTTIKKKDIPLLAPAITVAIEMGVPIDSIQKSLPTLEISNDGFNLFRADNQSQIWFHEGPVTTLALERITHLISDIPEEDNLIVVAWPGSIPTKLQERFAHNIGKLADVFICREPEMIKIIKRDNTRTQVVKIVSKDEVSTNIRRYLVAESSVVMIGNIPAELLAELSAN
ncbi:MAG: hypothetical protein JNK26_04680 [Candidatus Doudnabacteria bacterium]|nr:hypothetical protein [Candidatus Doudnabacteria bacterium]